MPTEISNGSSQSTITLSGFLMNEDAVITSSKDGIEVFEANGVNLHVNGITFADTRAIFVEVDSADSNLTIGAFANLVGQSIGWGRRRQRRIGELRRYNRVDLIRG